MSVIGHLLIHSAEIKRIREIPTMLGGETQTYEQLATGVPCRLVQGPQQSDVDRGGIEAGEATGAIYFNDTQDVQRDDQVVISGITFDVLGASQPSVRTAYLKATVREKQIGATL